MANGDKLLALDERGDLYLNLHPDRLEVVNPGRLPIGVTLLRKPVDPAMLRRLLDKAVS